MGLERTQLSQITNSGHRQDLCLGHDLSHYPILPEYGLPVLTASDDALALCRRLAPPDKKELALESLLMRHERFNPKTWGPRVDEPYCGEADAIAGRGWRYIASLGDVEKSTVVEFLDIRKLFHNRESIVASVVQSNVEIRFKCNSQESRHAGESTGIALIGEEARIVSPVVIAVYNDGHKLHFIYDIDRPRRMKYCEDPGKAPGFVWQVRLAELSKEELRVLFPKLV